jgi:hypothetical protein
VCCAFALRSGLAQTLDVNVGGQAPLQNLITYDYDKPVVDRLVGCTPGVPDNSVIVECPPAGNTLITLIGRSFGSGLSVPGNQYPLAVLIDGKPCTSLTMTNAHTQVRSLARPLHAVRPLVTGSFIR